ncbi:DUF4245 family protein [Nocardioides acrostichi]|uniref:DUF4245 family protein n=1 Tax=Nocardioides acrostichi TaxID=2784339 RepID=A0A930YCK5_9ACTN|nr:DUF4245 family protein [Nocardioides acrostichi]MBF4163598.1 DUF4245 family protein [Nocardioides acrostichi]
MSQTSSPTAPPEKPGRYQRSAAGLVSSMLVLVAAVVVVAWGLGAFRTTAEFDGTPPAEYASVVAGLEESDLGVTFPPTIPSGWQINDVAYDPAKSEFTLALLTDSGTFAGLYDGHAPLAKVLRTYVDENPTQGAPVELTDHDGTTTTWQTYTDTGGDRAYVRTAKLTGKRTGRTEVTLVYGSASSDDLATLVGALTTK